MQTDLRLILLIIGLFVVAAIFLDGIKRRKNTENAENAENNENNKNNFEEPILTNPERTTYFNNADFNKASFNPLNTMEELDPLLEGFENIQDITVKEIEAIDQDLNQFDDMVITSYNSEFISEPIFIGILHFAPSYVLKYKSPPVCFASVR